MQNVPVMGDLLRSITMRAIRRVMDDAAVAVDKVWLGGVGDAQRVSRAARALCLLCCRGTLQRPVLSLRGACFLRGANAAPRLGARRVRAALRRSPDTLFVGACRGVRLAVQIQAGLKAGRTVQDVLRELCGVFDEEGHANGAVKSFAVDGGDEEEEEEEEEQGKEEGKDAVSFGVWTAAHAHGGVAVVRCRCLRDAASRTARVASCRACCRRTRRRRRRRRAPRRRHRHRQSSRRRRTGRSQPPQLTHPRPRLVAL